MYSTYSDGYEIISIFLVSLRFSGVQVFLWAGVLVPLIQLKTSIGINFYFPREDKRKSTEVNDFRDRDLLRPPEDLIDVAVGPGRWQILVTLMLSFCVFTSLINTGTETLLRPSGWWCKMPDFLHHWTEVQWILYSHSKDSVRQKYHLV